MTSVEIAHMTPRERLDLISALWDSLSPDDVSLSSAQAAELANRMATFEIDAKVAKSWADIKSERTQRAR